MLVVVSKGKYLGTEQNTCYPVCMKVSFVLIMVCVCIDKYL